MTVIREEHPMGLPWGRYAVRCYRMRDGRMQAVNDGARDVSSSYVEKLKPGTGEAYIATCLSSPGGVKLYGSERVRQLVEEMGGVHVP